MTSNPMPKWLDSNGNLIACTEKVKVMQENMNEFAQNAQDILEDAILIGCEEQQVKDYMHNLIKLLVNPFENQ